jgi:hypothetical protein
MWAHSVKMTKMLPALSLTLFSLSTGVWRTAAPQLLLPGPRIEVEPDGVRTDHPCNSIKWVIPDRSLHTHKQAKSNQIRHVYRSHEETKSNQSGQYCREARTTRARGATRRR